MPEYIFDALEDLSSTLHNDLVIALWAALLAFAAPLCFDDRQSSNTSCDSVGHQLVISLMESMHYGYHDTYSSYQMKHIHLDSLSGHCQHFLCSIYFDFESWHGCRSAHLLLGAQSDREHYGSCLIAWVIFGHEVALPYLHFRKATAFGIGTAKEFVNQMVF